MTASALGWETGGRAWVFFLHCGVSQSFADGRYSLKDQILGI